MCLAEVIFHLGHGGLIHGRFEIPGFPGRTRGEHERHEEQPTPVPPGVHELIAVAMFRHMLRSSMAFSLQKPLLPKELFNRGLIFDRKADTTPFPALNNNKDFGAFRSLQVHREPGAQLSIPL